MNAACFYLFVTWALLGGVQPYSERGFADFDDFFDALAPHGVWRPQGEDKYIFITNPPTIPYRNGQWIYTDFGWTWRGYHAASWATEHYGHWILHKETNTWLWIPGSKWYPAIIQWRVSGDYIGWRACRFDAYGNPVEKDKNNHEPNEWNFVLKEKLKSPLKSDDFASLEQTKKLLEQSAPIQHIFKAWRDIAREGPDPLAIWKNEPLPKRTIRNLPSPNIRPKEAGPEDAFFYRPKFHQDTEGIFHRIQILLKRNDPTSPQENSQQKVLETLGNISIEDEEEAAKPVEQSILFQEATSKQK